MTTLHIINAQMNETHAEYWTHCVRVNRWVAPGQYPVVASINMDDRFADERDAWARSVLDRWTRMAGCARRGVYVAVIGEETVAAVVAGLVREPWVVVRGTDDQATICQEGFENGAPVLWYQTETDALAAADRYREQIRQIGREEGTDAARVEAALASLNVRVVEAAEEWDWVIEQQWTTHRGRMVDGLLYPEASA